MFQAPFKTQLPLNLILNELWQVINQQIITKMGRQGFKYTQGNCDRLRHACKDSQGTHGESLPDVPKKVPLFDLM